MANIQNSPKQIALKKDEQLLGLADKYRNELSKGMANEQSIPTVEAEIFENPVISTPTNEPEVFVPDEAKTNAEIIESIEPVAETVVNVEQNVPTNKAETVVDDLDLEAELIKVTEQLNNKLVEVIIASSAASDLLDKQRELIGKLKSQGKNVNMAPVEKAESIIEQADNLFAPADISDMTANIFDTPESGMTL